MKLRDIIDPLLAFLKDARGAEELLDKEASQFARRAYMRSVFAYIEGSTWSLKQTCLNARSPSGKRGLSVAEYALLRDEGYELKTNGDPLVQTKFLRLPDNIKFSNKVFNRLFGSNIGLGIGDKNWNSFLQAIKVRNRITHPKSLADYDVTDAEIAVCRDTTHWYNDVVHGYILAITASTQRSPSAEPIVPRDAVR